MGYEQLPRVLGEPNGGTDAGSFGGSSVGGGGGTVGAAGTGGTGTQGGTGGAAGMAAGGVTGSGGGPLDSGTPDAGCGTTGCDPWWDSTFTRRRKLTFDQVLQAEDVAGLSVLVRLDPTRIDYGATQGLGQDLRFVDDDGITVLPHEVERWTAGGTSILWVRVPRIDGATNLDHVWMYYGNKTAPDGQARDLVWAGYDAVYHLDGFGDSAGKQPAAVDHGTADIADGIGHARELDGTTAYVDLGLNLPLLESRGAMTLSLRVRVRSIVGERALVSFSVNSAVPSGLSRAFVSFVNTADVRAGGRAHDVDAASSFLTTTGSPMSVGTATWSHVTAIIDLGTQEILIFVDGSAKVTDALSTPFTAAVTDATPTSFNVLGASDEGGSQFLDGALDEVRITPTRRAVAWVQTDARSESDALIRFGNEEVF